MTTTQPEHPKTARDLVEDLMLSVNYSEPSIAEILADIEKAGYVLIPRVEQENAIKAAKMQALREEAEWWRAAGHNATGSGGRTIAMTVAAQIELHAVVADD